MIKGSKKGTIQWKMKNAISADSFKIVGVGRKTLEKLLDGKKIKYKKVGKTLVFSLSGLSKIMQEMKERNIKSIKEDPNGVGFIPVMTKKAKKK